MMMAVTELAKGDVQWHSSEEGGGPDVGLLLALGDGHFLWAGEITKARWEDAGAEASELGNDFGWWLILYRPEGADVIGKCLSSEAAQAMIDILSSSLTPSPR